MSKIILKIIFVIFFSFIFGCISLPDNAKYNPLDSNYINHFTDVPEFNQVKDTEGFIVCEFENSYSEVWENTLIILMQQSIFIRTEKGQKDGIIFFVIVDGVFLEKYKRFFLKDFPFYISIEQKNENVTKLRLFSVLSIYEGKEKLLKPEVVKLAFSQKANDLIESLKVQLSANNRWPWLIE